MLEINSASETVVAMRATGLLDAADIEQAIRAVDATLARQERIALYAEIDITGMTPGALARDVRYGMGRLRAAPLSPSGRSHKSGLGVLDRAGRTNYSTRHRRQGLLPDRKGRGDGLGI